MPDFYEKMKNRLRTAEQGADTAVWLAISDAALKQPSGLFFQGAVLCPIHYIGSNNNNFNSIIPYLMKTDSFTDRQPVATHLPLAWTHSTKEEDLLLMSQLDNFLTKFQSA